MRIAVVGPFSGPRAAWGELLRNAAARSHDAPIVWEFHDDRGDASTARSVGVRVVRPPSPAAVIGHFNSLGAHYALPGYRQARLPALLPLSTRPGLLDGSDGWALRWCPDDDGQLAALRTAVLATGRTSLDVADDGSDYGRRLADSATALSSTGLTTVRTAARSAGDGALLICGTHAGAARTARQAVDAGRTGPLLFPDDCAIGEFAELLGESPGQALVARLTGSPASLVDNAFRALTAALTAQPEARERQLLTAVRAQAGFRFTTGGEPTGRGPDGGWEVVPVRTLAPATAGRQTPPDHGA
ncbi:ABC transporter substrate-binding protein [Streptomyces lonarensis]|uniref:ABC transporter substrate-binding protein n=1 Tax=Streptomyces lonarensis TaxID=700599 RepID=A0A7X6CY05_9ACTN|nr:ABC transporter substrate-binding protein [Streptomyces lonarensis]NJQ04671.1 ABC transporter substrate-binding protein [Streptomyces lonarensis]